MVIAAPYTNLVDQWENVCAEWYIPTIKLDKGWTKQIRNEISSINQTSEKRLTVFICSHAKFARDELLDEIKFCKVNNCRLVDYRYFVCGAFNMPKLLMPLLTKYMKATNTGMQLSVMITKN